MDFRRLFNSYSRRAPMAAKRLGLTPAFRNRVVMRVSQMFLEAGVQHQWIVPVRLRLAYLYGTTVLRPYSDGTPLTPEQDIHRFLSSCSDEQFFDFIEQLFQSDVVDWLSYKDQLIDDINNFLAADHLPFRLTPFVWVRSIESWNGADQEVMRCTETPQVIRADSEAMQESTIEPALALLRDKRFEHANREYLDGLSDFRRGKYGDALTKVGSAFESVLTVICKERGWKPSGNTATPLIKAVLTGTNLESFHEAPLMAIVTMRNRLSTAHGAGDSPRAVTEAKVQYAISAVGNAMLFLAREALGSTV